MCGGISTRKQTSNTDVALSRQQFSEPVAEGEGGKCQGQPPIRTSGHLKQARGDLISHLMDHGITC